MRIALVISHYNGMGGGAERWTDRYARWLLERRHEVHLVARRFEHAPGAAKCHRVDVPRGPRSRLRFAQAAERMIGGIDVDVVHDMGDGWRADVFMPHHGTRRGGFRQNTLLLPRWLRWSRSFAWNWLPRYREFRELERRQFEVRPGKRFIALSHMVAGHMHDLYGVPLENVDVVYNGVDTNLFRPPENSAQRDAFRRKWGVSDRTVFLLVAHNFTLKGLDVLIAALAGLNARGASKAALLVAGNGDVGRYQRLAARQGVADSLRFVGNQPNPLCCYHAADVYVQPTLYDPCSLVVLEALACGLPIVTSSCNGAGELLAPGVEGKVVSDPRDSMGLAAAMRTYLDPGRRQDAGRAARKLALRYSFDHNCESLLAVYQRRLRHRSAA